MTTKHWLIGLSLIMGLLCTGSLMAQDAAQPLILVRAGDLWDWTGGPTLRQKTQWGYNGGLALSPINDEVAYSSYATITTDAIKREGGFGGGSLPNNLWVITTESSDLAYRPADQPVGASFMTPGKEDNALIRSNAMWSPDGTQIAWAETNISGDGTYQLMVYDKDTATSRSITEGLPQQYGQGAGLNGIWTSSGIVLYSYTYNDVLSAPQDSIIVIDPQTGDIRLTAPLEDIATGNDNLRAMLKLPVWLGNKEWLGVLYIGSKATSQWVLIDLETGAFQTTSTPPSATIPSDTLDNLRVTPKVLDADSIGYEVTQRIDGAPVALNTDEHNQILRFALSPDGQGIAYQLYDPADYQPEPTIYVWRNGSLTTVPQTDFPSGINEFVWGTVVWSILE